MAIIKYGLEWDSEKWNDLNIELCCFRKKWPSEKGGLGRLGHYQELLKLLYPKMVYTEWTHRMHEAFCRDEDEVILTGPASAGKSWEIARFAIIWALSSGGNFAVPVTSTSVQMSRKRIWAKLKTMASTASDACLKKFKYPLPFHVVDSSTEIRMNKGDSEHSIAIIPGSQKYVQDGVTKLKGWHAEYILVVADELQDMTDEVIQSCANMRSGTKEFKFIGSGNGCSWMNTMGKLIIPESGNPESVTVEMDEWKTKTGVCIHFDGLKSPGLFDDTITWNQTQNDIDKIVNQYGEDSLQYWQMVRGFPPPDDSFNAVVSESLLLKFQAIKQQELSPGWETYAALDSAFGGDVCVVKTAKVGTFILPEGESARVGVVFGDKLEIKTVASKTEPIDFQIAEQAIAFCKAKGIKPQNFAVDGTGTGRGVMAIIRKQWSNEIHGVEFGGSASDLPVSSQDFTKGCEAYWNSVTELYFAFRTFVMNGQVRGITSQMARAFGCRTYTVKNGRSMLSSKLEARKILGRSPDEEDASVMIVDCMRRQGYFAGPMGFGAHWVDAVREAAALEEYCEYAPSDPMLVVQMIPNNDFTSW